MSEKKSTIDPALLYAAMIGNMDAQKRIFSDFGKIDIENDIHCEPIIVRDYDVYDDTNDDMEDTDDVKKVLLRKSDDDFEKCFNEKMQSISQKIKKSRKA